MNLTVTLDLDVGKAADLAWLRDHLGHLSSDTEVIAIAIMVARMVMQERHEEHERQLAA